MENSLSDARVKFRNGLILYGIRASIDNIYDEAEVQAVKQKQDTIVIKLFPNYEVVHVEQKVSCPRFPFTSKQWIDKLFTLKITSPLANQ